MKNKLSFNTDLKWIHFLKAFTILLTIYILFTMFAPAIRWGYLKTFCKDKAEAEIYKIEEWDTLNGGVSYPSYRIYYRFRTADAQIIEGAPESGILYRAGHLFSTYQKDVTALPSGTAVKDQTVIYYNKKAPEQFYAEGSLSFPAPGIFLVAASILIILIYFIANRQTYLCAIKTQQNYTQKASY